jgi:predicted Ser/Thr protein kinase
LENLSSNVELSMPPLVSSIRSDELTIGEPVGAGSFGTVFKGRWRGIDVAVKKCQANKISDNI